jgi:hypothetical protein
MSYCTIEEAWGHLGSPSSNTPCISHQSSKKNKHRKLKKRVARTSEKNKGVEERCTNTSVSTHHETFANPTDEHDVQRTCPVVRANPSVRYEEVFTRNNQPVGNVPEAIDVTLDGAPFALSDNDSSRSPDAVPNSVSFTYPPDALMTQQDTDSDTDYTQESVAHLTDNHRNNTSYDDSPRVVKDELEWMRNNMSHLSHKIDKLTDTIDLSKHNQPQGHSNIAYDTFLFILIGVFVLFALDIFYRAGAHSV